MTGLLLRVIGLLLPRADRADIIGDLVELHAGKSSAVGRLRGFLWLVTQLIGLVPGLALFRVRAFFGMERAWRGDSRMMSLVTDLRHSIRLLRVNKIHSAVTIITLAVGIGANTAVFSVVNGVLLRQLPFPEADRLVAVEEYNEMFNISLAIRGKDFHAWFANQQSFDDWTVYNQSTGNLVGLDEPHIVSPTKVIPGFFRMLGGAPVLGRAFTAADLQSEDPHLAVLGYGLWQRVFGGSTEVLGRNITIDDQSYQVVGVMQSEFDTPAGTDLWTLRDISRETDSNYFSFAVIGLLAPGATPLSAQTELANVAERLQQESPATHEGWTARVTPLLQSTVGDVRLELLLLFGAVSIVLFIACVNIANFTLAQALRRSRETALRAALGAGRGRLVRQFLTESILISIIGAAIGVWLARLGLNAFLATIPQYSGPMFAIENPFGSAFTSVPRLTGVAIDAPVLVYTLVVAVMTGVLIGLLPAIRYTRPDINVVISRANNAAGAGNRVRRLLVGAEVTLATVALIVSGLLVTSFLKLRAVDPGFDPAGILSLRIEPPEFAYPEGTDQVRLYDELLQRLRVRPGFREVAASSSLPFDGSDALSGIEIVGGDPELTRLTSRAGAVSGEFVRFRLVSPGYFRSIGIDLVEGRDFDEADRSPLPIAAVNQRFAAKFLDDRSLGREVKISWAGDQEPREIVGVVSDVRHNRMDAPPAPEIYIPYWQSANTVGGMTFVVPLQGETSEAVDAFRSELRAIDPNLPVASIAMAEDRIAGALAQPRFYAGVMGVFSLAGLALACLGIAGLLAAIVAERTRDIGIRLAMGAKPGRIVRETMWFGLAPTIVGLILGVALSLGLTRMLTVFLYDVGAADPYTYGMTGLILLSVAGAAAMIPARRATAVDPISVLKAE